MPAVNMTSAYQSHPHHPLCLISTSTTKQRSPLSSTLYGPETGDMKLSASLYEATSYNLPSFMILHAAHCLVMLVKPPVWLLNR